MIHGESNQRDPFESGSKQGSNTYFRSTRKISPSESTQLLSLSLKNNSIEEHISLLETQNVQCESNCSSSMTIMYEWIFHEYLTTSSQEKMLKNTLSSMQVICAEAFEKDKKITRGMWQKLQIGLPKPRLFDTRFIAAEKKTLENLNKIEAEKKIEVGEKVWGFVGKCEHTHLGHVVSMQKNTYLIKFSMPWLGTLKIPISLVGPLSSGSNGINNPLIAEMALSDTYLVASSRYLELLQLKSSLLNCLKSYNNLAESRQKPQLLMENELQEYGWLGSMIGLINLAVRRISEDCSLFSLLENRKACKSTKGEKCEKGLPILVAAEGYTRLSRGSESSFESKREEVERSLSDESKEERILNESEKEKMKMKSGLNVEKLPNEIEIASKEVHKFENELYKNVQHS